MEEDTAAAKNEPADASAAADVVMDEASEVKVTDTSPREEVADSALAPPSSDTPAPTAAATAAPVAAPKVQDSEPATAAAPVEVKPFLRGTFFRDVASNSLGAPPCPWAFS